MPIFSTFVGYYAIRVLNIGLLHFPLLLDLVSMLFYTTIAFESYTSPNFLECY